VLSQICFAFSKRATGAVAKFGGSWGGFLRDSDTMAVAGRLRIVLNLSHSNAQGHTNPLRVSKRRYRLGYFFCSWDEGHRYIHSSVAIYRTSQDP
jgi:hypothetical protein